MTVIHAEALAGGIFRPLSAGGNAANTALAFGNERTKARRAAADLTRLTVQLARLEAERKSEREFVTPDRARATADPKEVSEIVAAQQSLMNSRQATYDATIKSLARVRDNTETELRLERERLTKAEALLKNRRSRLAKLRELADRRIISEERTLGEEAAVMELEERISALALNQMRLEKGRMGAELEISILERKRAADVEAEIQSVERDLAKLQIDLDGASSSFRTLSGQSALDTASDAGAITTYRIVRTIDGASKVLRADKSTPLVPGDVLLVELDNGGRS